jgi:glycosyltransferase involved in cell wall biosynthesis
MPCFNYGAYIEEAVVSVLEQDDRDWELVIVDDGSTDDSLKRAKQFTDPRIRVVHQPNAGVSAARNTGLRVASGAHIAFLDADDRYLPRRISSTREVLELHPELDMVVTNFRRFEHSTSAVLGTQFDLVPEWRDLPLTVLNPVGVSGSPVHRIEGSPVREFSRLPLAIVWVQLVTIRGTLARSASFPPGVRICEDSWYLYRLMQKHARIGILDEVLTELRRHGHNSFTNPSDALLPEFTMYCGLANEAESTEARSAFLAAANRMRIGLGYHYRHHDDRRSALAWYIQAAMHGPARTRALSGIVATLIGR